MRCYPLNEENPAHGARAQVSLEGSMKITLHVDGRDERSVRGARSVLADGPRVGSCARGTVPETRVSVPDTARA